MRTASPGPQWVQSPPTAASMVLQSWNSCFWHPANQNSPFMFSTLESSEMDCCLATHHQNTRGGTTEGSTLWLSHDYIWVALWSCKWMSWNMSYPWRTLPSPHGCQEVPATSSTHQGAGHICPIQIRNGEQQKKCYPEMECSNGTHLISYGMDFAEHLCQVPLAGWFLWNPRNS